MDCRSPRPSGCSWHHYLVTLDGLTPLILEAEAELYRLSQQEPWRE